MNSYVPSLQFASLDSGLSLPEFYLDYPIFVSSDEYEDLKDEVHKVYKIYDGTSDSVQLIPEEYLETHTLMSDIVSVTGYYCDSIGNEEYLIQYKEDVYDFYSITGELTFAPTQAELSNIFIDGKEEIYKDINDYEGWIVLEVNIEKFRNISSTEQYQVEIAPEEANRIATAQSAHASMLEYLYQFTIAQNTQQRLSEIAYTSFVTIVSTLITIGITMGVGKLTSSLAEKSTAFKDLATSFGSKVAENVGKKCAEEATKLLGRITSSTSYHYLFLKSFFCLHVTYFTEPV
ncbi:MAG: hypothetical protein V3V33_12035 [Candidatus Lokiarchaeia archaeon]